MTLINLKNALLRNRDQKERESILNEKIYQQNRQHTALIKQNLMSCLRPATTPEFADWLKKYYQKHGAETMTLFKGATSGIFVATKSLCLPAFYGADAMNIIVPEKITVLVVENNLGHNSLYLNDGELKSNIGGLIIYEDVLSYLN